ncbi:synaptic vesicle 2-related protein, partial [Trichonephila clavata]
AYPTTFRAIAMGTGTSFCRLGGLLVPYVAQVLVIENPIAAMCLLGGLVFLAGVAAALCLLKQKELS